MFDNIVILKLCIFSHRCRSLVTLKHYWKGRLKNLTLHGWNWIIETNEFENLRQYVNHKGVSIAFVIKHPDWDHLFEKLLQISCTNSTAAKPFAVNIIFCFIHVNSNWTVQANLNSFPKLKILICHSRHTSF